MKPKLTNWLQELDSDAADEYNALRRSLQRNSGFGLFFVQCSPATGSDIIAEIKEDVSNKKVEVLHLDKAIDSLYTEITNISNLKEIDILFISGLEHSLIEYENHTFNSQQQNSENSTEKRLSQDSQGVPRFLGYLNLQRDRFREEFDVSFVFIIPIFGINYFIKRAPDFFDWRSGFFRFVPEKSDVLNIDHESIFKSNVSQLRYKLLDFKVFARELELDVNEQIQLSQNKSLLLIGCNRLEEAIASYDNILAIDPKNEQALFNRGSTLGILKRYEEAVSDYDKCLAINPNDYKAWFSRGINLGRLERYEEAITSYDQALEINPDDYRTWNNRGIALEKLVRHEEAVVSCDKSLEINPDDYRTWHNRGIALGELGRYEEAVVSYNKALEINPDNCGTWYNRGIALRKLGRYEEAVVSYDQALEINPRDDQAWNNRGNALEKLVRHEEAVVSYNKALEINPDNCGTWYNRGIALRKLGRYEEVVVSYDQALEINPRDDEAWHNRGITLRKLGRYEEAVVSYDQALEINPRDDKAWSNRGVALGELVRHEEAVISYDKALEINPKNFHALSRKLVFSIKSGKINEARKLSKIIEKYYDKNYLLDNIDEQINLSTSKMRKLILNFLRLFLKLFG